MDVRHEVERTLRELVRQDGRVDMDELRLVCRHGIVRLGGTVPSEGEHRILVKLVTDVAGCHDVVDRLQVNEVLCERQRAAHEGMALAPEDIIESGEQGLVCLPPDRPPADEE